MPTLGDDVRRHEVKLADHDIQLALIRQAQEAYQIRAEERHGEVMKAIDRKKSKDSDEGKPPRSSSDPAWWAKLIGGIVLTILTGLAGWRLTEAPEGPHHPTAQVAGPPSEP